jgi:deoxyribonuclease-4
MLFGAHVSAAGGISKAIARIEEIGGDAVQVFTQSPRMWKPTSHTGEELDLFRERRREAGVEYVSCHALYLVNLASRDEAVRENSLAALRATMQTARGIGADAVVFHVGSHLGYGFDEAVEIITPAVEELLELTTDDLWLCMENAAGAGGTIGRSIAELAILCDAAARHPRLGICLDSCHWWASGIDVSDRNALATALADV